MRKNAIITTISDGYMFALNANFNSNKLSGTNADYHVIYHDAMEVPYMLACTEAFKEFFNIVWIRMSDVSHDFHNAKYKYAKTLKDQYEVVCLIDADLFIMQKLNIFFDTVRNTGDMISAQHLWSGGKVEDMHFSNYELCIDRIHAQVADFPVFVNPNDEKVQNFFQDWYDFAAAGDKEENHPLVAFNRSICKHFKASEVSLLDGRLWVADKDFWNADYRWDREQNKLIVTYPGETPLVVSAIHNKWWKIGRANGEFRANAWVKEGHPHMQVMRQGEKNFNEIKDMMAFFNDMTPETKRTDYLQERIDMRIGMGTI